MSEPEERDNWASLADLMGIQPLPPEEKPKEQAAAPEAEPVSESTPAPVSPPPRRPEVPRRSPVDWEQLAAELGVASSPPPVTPEPVSEPVAASEPVAEASVPESDEPLVDLEAEEQARVRAEAWQSERVEVSAPVFLDAPEGEEPEVAEIVEAAAAGEADAVEQAVVESGAQPERGERRRRRKKRRRRKSGESAVRSEEGASVEFRGEGGESAPVDMGPAEQDLKEVLSGEPVAASEPPAEDAAEGERRDGRKRRRRRRKKRSGEASAAGAEALAGESASEVTAAHEAVAAAHGEVAAELAAAREEDEDSSGRLSHRAIPTWDQAIGLMIARNMEARAKHPNGPSRRGGKGRRPDRGRS